MIPAARSFGRDWEIIPIRSALGRKFAYDIFPSEFQKITGDLSLMLLSDPDYLKAKAGDKRIAPMIRRGAEITTKMIKALHGKKCTVVPVLIPGEPKPLNALTQFARQQTLLLAGRVYGCVDDWLKQKRRDRAIGVIQAVKKYRTPLLQSLNNALKDWEAVIVTLINDILAADENLTIMSLFDEFIGDFEKAKLQKEHSVEVAVLALMLGRKCHLPVEDLKELGLAALIHDIGMVVYEQKLRELIDAGGQVLEPGYIKDIYDLHPQYGAVLVSKKNGEPISGISSKTRDIILEHERNNNDPEPQFADPELREELRLMKIPDTIFYEGDNVIYPDSNRPREIEFPDGAGVKRYISIPAQILHISEMYVTILNHLKLKMIKNPHQKTIRKMLKAAGDDINGQIFEVFFNNLIPPTYYPDNLIVTLFFKNRDRNKKYEKYNKHTGIVTTVTDLSKQTRKMVKVIKSIDGTEISPPVSFDLIFDKKNLYLKIDDWSRYRNTKEE